MNVHKLILALMAFVGLSILFGCGGNGGGGSKSLFAGTREIGFYDEDNSNSSWGGWFEVQVHANGTFDEFGFAYTYGPDQSHEGKVIGGRIDDDGNFRVEARFDTLSWPDRHALPNPYYVVATGRFVPEGGHYTDMGDSRVKYYETTNFSAGQEYKDIPYDMYSRSLPGRSVSQPKNLVEFPEHVKTALEKK